MKVIAGLGNPGPKYESTRHNLGFMVLDAAAAKFRVAMEGKAHRAITGRGRMAGVEVLLVKPQTFMNLSGESVGPITASEGLSASDIVVVHDDLDIPLGRLKVSVSGGDGGHNGIASVIETLGTGTFTRLRVGIGRPPAGVDPVEFVLTPFGPDDTELVEKVIMSSVEALVSIVREGPARAMNRFNKKLVEPDTPETGESGAGE